ncbi:choice-of-anchor Q domain-containing protein [Dokdonella fugitiva]|uniref:Parallel beta helix pectate lyase-like protein n=1 Tax=Dokdonella fugitiva TaxID=328517 RepID=A0A4R2IFZ6_9GAMM|nr:choice-of-anchor Q domain-containing protein [Dokdonella fugitiva]TCO43122.1 hypothetical protein EV148_101541 [Dokdonella fugitiva]
MNVLRSVACAAAMLLAGPPAHAAFYCVNTSLALAIALNQAQSNGEDDDIELEVGTYALGGELDYFAADGETYDLTIRGGSAPGTGCFERATSGASVLDGQDAVRPLYISAHGRVDVIGITFENGAPTQYAGGALNLSAPIARVESSVFVANHDAPGNVAAAAYVSATSAYVVGNVFLANAGASTVTVYSDFVADVNNNTVVGNQLHAHAGIGALNLVGDAQFNLSNNILWNNEGSDVFDQSSGGADYWHNDVGVIANMPPHSVSGNLDVDPQFDGFLGLRPAPTSPMVNAGIDSPLGGVGGTDAGGGPRIIGQHVDIGAYETDVLFRNGLEQAT